MIRLETQSILLKEKINRMIGTIRKFYDTLGQEPSLPKQEPDASIPIQFTMVDEEVPQMVAIDGSFTWLWNPPGTSIWLLLIRTGAVIFSVGEVEGQEGYQFIDYVLKDDVELVTPYGDLAREISSLHQDLNDFAGKTGIEGLEKETIALGLLRYNEQTLLSEIADQYKNVIIAVDGTLTTHFLQPFRTLMEKVVRTCERNENLLVGVSKDSQLHSFSNYYIDEEYFKRSVVKDPHKLFYFQLPAEVVNRTIRTPLYGDVYYAKLHPYAPKWFRIDVGTHKDRPKEVFSQLARYSRSVLSPGFIHPALEAHKLVVSIRFTRGLYENLIFDAGTELGFTAQDIFAGLINREGQSQNSYHSYLDFISK